MSCVHWLRLVTLSDHYSNAGLSWWRHQKEKFSALLAFCAGNSPVTGEFPSQRPVTWSFDVFFDLRLNKRLSKQPWGWWLEMTSRSLWRRCNVASRDVSLISLYPWLWHNQHGHPAQPQPHGNSSMTYLSPQCIITALIFTTNNRIGYI